MLTDICMNGLFNRDVVWLQQIYW